MRFESHAGSGAGGHAPARTTTIVAGVCRGLFASRDCGDHWVGISEYPAAAFPGAAQDSAPAGERGEDAMRFGACPREPEVTELLGRGHWPQASTDELRAHVAGCRACRQLVVVREAFGRER